MAYKLKIDMPNLRKGALVQIAGLGSFENGSTNNVSDEQHDSFRRFHRQVVPTYDEETGEIVGSEFKQGQTLLQASENMHGVEVETANRESDAERQKREKAEKEAASQQNENPQGGEQ